MTKERKPRNGTDYVHFILATINLMIIIGVCLYYEPILWLKTLLIIIIMVYYGIFCYFFTKKNPYLFVLNFGSTICSLVILILNLFFFWIIVIPLFIYLIYLFSNLDISWSKDVSWKKFISRYGFLGYSPNQVSGMWQDDTVDSVKQKYKEQIKLHKKREKLNLIFLITLTFTVGFITLYIYYNILLYEFWYG